jgi:hypothetical protein
LAQCPIAQGSQYSHGTAKADCEALVLWEYGGIYTDVDKEMPQGVQRHHYSNHRRRLFVVETSSSQFFFRRVAPPSSGVFTHYRYYAPLADLTFCNPVRPLRDRPSALKIAFQHFG